MNVTPPARRRAFFALPALLTVLLLLVIAAGARAGMNNQPKPPADAAAKIRAAAADILGTGDLGKARPALYLAVEAHAATDLTDLLAAVVRDDTVYNGLVSVFEDAARGKTGAPADFLTYNLARLHLLRSRQAGSSQGRSAALSQAAEAAGRLAKDNLRDAGAWELIGDIYAEQGKREQAEGAYSRIATSGATGAAAYAQLKIGALYHRANRLAQAEDAYQRGIRADAAGGNPRRETLHRLYQGLAALYLERGNENGAVDALLRSARVTQDPDAPFRLQMDVARRLLRLGRAREALTYTEAALRFAPGDAAAKTLRDQARAASK
jgi:tetratricopeptide (TPR) repeat protein